MLLRRVPFTLLNQPPISTLPSGCGNTVWTTGDPPVNPTRVPLAVGSNVRSSEPELVAENPSKDPNNVRAMTASLNLAAKYVKVFMMEEEESPRTGSSQHLLHESFVNSSVRLGGKFRNEFFQCDQLLFQVLDARFFLLHLLVQPLNRRQRHAVGIDGRDGFVSGTQAKSSFEILGDRAEMGRGGVVGIMPA